MKRYWLSAETFGMVLKFLYTCPEQKLRRNSFLIFLFRIFFGIWAKNFSDFRPKNFKKLSKLPSACPEEQFVLEIFFKTFEALLTFCRNIWHGSQVSIYVSRAKIAKKQFSYFSFQNFFSEFERKIFQTFGQRTSKSCQNYLLRVRRNNLWLEIFFKSFEA